LLTRAIRKYVTVPYRLTNAVKCFPPGDRKPKAVELGSCRSYLDAEVLHYRPDIIVAVGDVPLRHLTGKTGITSWSGRVAGTLKFESGDTESGVPPYEPRVFALIHPAFVLRAPGNLPKFEAGMRELNRLAVGGPSGNQAPVSEVDQEGFCNFFLAAGHAGKIIAFDYETNGHPWWSGGKLRCVSLSDGTSAVWMDVEKHGKAALQALLLFLDSLFPKAAHNISFETNWSRALFSREPRRLKWDTMLLHYLWNENSHHNLESVAGEVLGASPWDIHLEMKGRKWTWDTVPMEVLGPYNAMDSYWTARLAGVLPERLSPNHLKLYRRHIIKQARVCARMEWNGIRLDPTWAECADKYHEKAMSAIESEIRAHPKVTAVQKKLKDVTFNLRSAYHMRALVYDHLRMPVFERTPGGLPSTAEEVLDRLKGRSPLLGRIMAWRETETVRRRYLQKFPAYAHTDGIVRPGYNPARIVPGRIAVTDPPMQTLPTSAVVRGMVVSRWTGGKILSADYKQLEIRLVANESGDGKLIRSIAVGEDQHDKTASEIFGGKFTKDDRLIAKRINFGIVYGISPYSLAAQFNMTVDRAEDIFRRFRKARPMIFQWMARQHAFIEKHGYIKSRFGRKRRLPEIRHADEKLKARIFRQAGNFPIQSAGADITNLAMILVDRELRRRKLKSLLVLQVHDSLLVDLHPDEVNVVPDLVVNLMTKQVQRLCPWMRVKLEVDVSVEDRWGGATNVGEAAA